MPDNDDQSIFGNEQNTSENQNDTQGNDPLVEKLSAIKDADGRVKYSSVEAALDALPHANAHIDTMVRERQAEKEELARIQEELARTKGALETFQKFQEREPGTNQTPEPQTPQGPSQEDIVNLVETRIQAQRNEDVRRENESKVVSALSEVYGEEAANAFNQKAQELGMSTNEMNELARANPNMVLALFPKEKQDAGTGPIVTNVHVDTSTQPTPDGPLAAPEQSVLFMSTDQDQLREWRRHGEFVQKQNQ